jgi:hypothetical protein
MYSNHLTNNYEEEVINKILDRGINEIKISNNNCNSRDYLTPHYSSNKYNLNHYDRSSSNDKQQKPSSLKTLLKNLKHEYKINPPLKTSIMQSFIDTEDPKFDEMKFEIKDLQDKLTGLERHISSSGSKKKTNDYKTNSPYYVTTDYRRNRFHGGTINKKSMSMKGSKCANRRSLQTSKSKVNWMENYYKVNTDYEEKKTELIKERLKNAQLEKQIKQMGRKENNYDNLMIRHKELSDKFIMLERQLEESEAIRKEQARVILSMQSEVGMLRGTFEENSRKIYQNGTRLKEVLVKKKKKNKSKSTIRKKK